MSKLILIVMILFPGLARAEIMSPDLPNRSFGLGLSTLHVELPDRNREQRYRWDLQEYEKLPFHFRLHNRLSIARDTRPRADSIQVNHHFYEFYTGLQWKRTRLFRYALGLGPLLLLEQTITRIQLEETRERAYNRLQLGWLAEFQIDYAFNEAWELALNLALQTRPHARKQDYCFGVSLLFNTGIVRAEDPASARIPAPIQVSPH